MEWTFFFILDNAYVLYMYITYGIVGYTQTINLLCKSVNLVSVPHGDLIILTVDAGLELNSKPADLVQD